MSALIQTRKKLFTRAKLLSFVFVFLRYGQISTAGTKNSAAGYIGGWAFRATGDQTYGYEIDKVLSRFGLFPDPASELRSADVTGCIEDSRRRLYCDWTYLRSLLMPG
jgi:hypothetical protein